MPDYVRGKLRIRQAEAGEIAVGQVGALAASRVRVDPEVMLPQGCGDVRSEITGQAEADETGDIDAGDEGILEMRATQVTVVEIGFLDQRVAQIDLAQIRTGEIGLSQQAAAQIYAFHFGGAEIGVGEIGLGQVALCHLGAAEIGAGQRASDQLGLGHLGARHVGPIELRTGQVGAIGILGGVLHDLEPAVAHGGSAQRTPPKIRALEECWGKPWASPVANSNMQNSGNR